MDTGQVARIAALVCEAQGQEVDKFMLDLWELTVGDLDFDLGMMAAKLTLRNHDGFISPRTVRARASLLARDRINAVNVPLPPSRLSIADYEAWERGWKDAAVRGVTDPQEVAQAGLAAIGRTLDSLPPNDRPVPSVNMAVVASTNMDQVVPRGNELAVVDGEVLEGELVDHGPVPDEAWDTPQSTAVQYPPLEF